MRGRPMTNLRDLTYDDLLETALSLGEKPYRAEQIYGWVFKRGVLSIDDMTDIKKSFRERLKEDFHIKGLTRGDVKESLDGTRKFASMLEDGVKVESVLIPEAGRLTLCVSSQAGCALGCKFCLTGRGGFIRNLSLSELVGQVFSAFGLLREDERITNVVLMGMGEPLLNCENVLRFLKILTDPRGLGLSHNKVTLSTAGVIPGIKLLVASAPVNLAVSINAANDALRTSIMPINARYPLSRLMDVLRRYPPKGRKSVTVEYVMMKEVNDSIADGHELARLLKGLSCKINLIPFNPFPGARFSHPDERSVMRFAGLLRGMGRDVFVRFSKGGDILGACGQLSGVTEGAPTREAAQ